MLCVFIFDDYKVLCKIVCIYLKIDVYDLEFVLMLLGIGEVVVIVLLEKGVLMLVVWIRM